MTFDKFRVRNSLINARKLITKRDAWTQHHAAKDEHGDNVNSGDDRAVCWCATGALNRVTGSDKNTRQAAREILADIIQKYFDITCGLTLCDEVIIVNFNDKSKHEEVLTAFDKAIMITSQEY
jgi:hypothetical protein